MNKTLVSILIAAIAWCPAAAFAASRERGSARDASVSALHGTDRTIQDVFTTPAVEGQDILLPLSADVSAAQAEFLIYLRPADEVSAPRRASRTAPNDGRREQDTRGDLTQLAANPAAAPRAFDAGMGIRPTGAHPFPGINHDPLPIVDKGARFFPLKIDPTKRAGQRLLSRSIDGQKYSAWTPGPAGSVILPGNPTDEAGVELALKEFITDHPALLQGLRPEDFAVGINKVEGKEGVADMIYANFAQIHDNLLVEGSELQFKVKIYGDTTVLLPVEGQLNPALTVNTQGSLRPDQIAAAIRQRLGIPPLEWGTTDKIELGRRIMQIGGQWRTVDVFMVRARTTMVGVDVNSGESFAWDPRVNMTGAPQASVSGKGVEGPGPFIPGATIGELPLGYTEIVTSAGTVYADKDGKFVVPGEPGTTVKITAKLKGKTYEIHDKSFPELVVVTEAPAGTQLRVVFDPAGSDENRYAAAMLAYAINTTRDFAEKVLGKDIVGKTLGNANLPQTCNAHYEPWGENSVNGYKASSQCVNSSYLSVMAHEMGHKIHDFARKKFKRIVAGINGPVTQNFTSLHVIDNGGLSEGHGDTYANGITEDPRIGPDFLKEGSRREIRNAEDPPHQYSPRDEVHEGGKPWEEFAWEFRKEAIKLYGKARGVAIYENLIFPVIFAAKDVPDAIANVVLRDLRADGTVPHFELFDRIAGKRGIHPKNPGRGVALAAS